MCILLAKTRERDQYALALAGAIPRPEYLVLQEALAADLLDYADVAASDHPLVRRSRRRGMRFGLAMLAFLRRKEFDHFYCTGEDIAFPFAILMTAVADFGRTTAVVHNTGTPKRRLIMRSIPSITWRNIICIGEEQRRVVIEENRVPRELVHLFPYWTDTRFFSPRAADAPNEHAVVLSCGRERRDYATLQVAAAISGLPFHVIASGWSPDEGFGATDDIKPTENVTVEGRGLSFLELRQRYAAARVVVVPLQEVNYGAGVTTILEAMSMAKPVVASASTGIVDYLDDGISCLATPVGDAEALARSLTCLYGDTDLATGMGGRNRAFAERTFAVERHAARVAGLFGMTPAFGPLHRAGVRQGEPSPSPVS